YGVWICSGASRPRSGPTGSWWSWTNARAGSLGSVSMPAASMVSHLSDVQPRHSRATLDAEVHQLRQRSTLQIPSVASQSTDTGGNRNQVPPLRSAAPSIRGKANRHHSTRVFGSNVVLDNCRSGEQAARFQDLLQQPSHA